MERKRIKLEQVKLMLLNLPDVVIEEILLHLNAWDRKSIRLTCKRLYELCNSTCICMKEKIIWRKIDASIVNMQPALLPIGRSRYNLVICCYDALSNLQNSMILQFFEVNGAKMRSLVINNTDFIEGLLEAIIISCEDLRSLTLSPRFSKHSPSLDYFTLEPNTVTRPTVTYLELILPKHQPSKYFHRLLSVFPNVKQLKITLKLFHTNDAKMYLQIAQECSAIFDDIIKCGSNLESLKLNEIPLRQLSAKGSLFSEALSNLKDLSINFNCYEPLKEREKLYSCFSNLVSLELHGYASLQLVRVLENTQLTYLDISSSSMVLNNETFKALVSSKLKIVRLIYSDFEGRPMTVPDFSLEANKTVTDLYLPYIPSPKPLLLFLVYFRGLVHLSIEGATDEILQYIFQYQPNLRSLVLQNCKRCSVEGFCGSKDGRLKYSINNLQKLEYLSIGYVSCEIIASVEFKTVFNFPSLEYLRIIDILHLTNCYVVRCHAGVHHDLYENLTHLRSLRIDVGAIRPRKTILALLMKSKRLNYLRCDVQDGFEDSGPVIFINSKELSINLEHYKYKYPSGNSHYCKDLDRIVTRNEVLRKKLCSPKISSHLIDWIEV